MFTDLQAARDAGHPDLPVPLTFLFTLESDGRDTLAFTVELGIDARRVLHGEQHFGYPAWLHAGDDVSIRSRVVKDDMRPGRGLRIVSRETEVIRDGAIACLLRATWIVRL